MDSISYLKKKKKAQNSTINKDGLLGKVGYVTQPICVPGNSALTIPGRLGKNTKVPSGTPCLIDTAAVSSPATGNFCKLLPSTTKRQDGASHSDEPEQP